MVVDNTSKFKVGDRVRYITDTPHYGADTDVGEMTICAIGGGDFDDDVELNYRGEYMQTARLVDIELATPASANDNTTQPAYSLTALGDAYVAGYKAGLAAQQAAAQQAQAA